MDKIIFKDVNDPRQREKNQGEMEIKDKKNSVGKNTETPESTILETSKDENFPGSTIFKVQYQEGKIKGYAIRAKEDGTFEGSEISYQPDGSIGAVQKLNETDIAKLQQQGILEKYEAVKKSEIAQKQDNARIWITRLSLQGGDPFRSQSKTPAEKMNVDEATKALENLNPVEQASLADMIFEEKIGNSPSSDSVRQLYGMYVNLKGTVFAERIRDLEDKRLRDAGQDGFKL